MDKIFFFLKKKANERVLLNGTFLDVRMRELSVELGGILPVNIDVAEVPNDAFYRYTTHA